MRDNIVCAFLYAISKHGYPPLASATVQHIEEMMKLGFTHIELEAIGEQNIHYLFENREIIADKIESSNINVPIFCIVLPHLSSSDNSVIEYNLELFDKGCQIADALGAEGVLDNGPLPPYQYPPNMPIKRHYSIEDMMSMSLPDQFDWAEYSRTLAETFRKACDIALSYDMDYHMHPCMGSLISTTDSFENFLNQVNRANLKFNLDTANQFFLKDNLSLSLERLKDHISYIHLSDNMGTQLGHLSLGKGCIPWDEFFGTLKKINYQGYYGLDIGGAETEIDEIDAAYLESLVWLQQKLDAHGL